MTALALAGLAGVLVALFSPGAPRWEVAAALLWVALATLFLRRHSRGWTAVAFAMLGWSMAAFHAGACLEKRWAASRDGDRVLADLVVETIPVAHGDAWSFEASVRGAAIAEAPLNVRVLSRNMNVRPAAGERWQLVLALRPPRARLNPGAVDVERHYFRERIHALGTVVTSRLNQRIDAGHRPLTQMREAVARRIERRVDDRDASALIQALAVGAAGSMSAQQWQVFNATGTSHLVAISGLHVTLFATVAFFISRRLWFALLWRFTSWPRDSVAALVALCASFAYSLLAGLSVPTQRTLIMLAAWLLSRSLARVSTPFGPLWIALIAVLALDPFAPLAAGFWLSFVAMAAIILATESRIVRRTFWHGMASTQAAVTVALAPLSVAWFGSISAAGVLVNAVAIPAVSWVFVPTILAAVLLMPVFPTASDAVLDLAARLHEHGWSWLVAAAEWPSAVLRVQPPGWWYPLAALAAGAALMPLPMRLRLAAIFWVLPAAFVGHHEIPAAGWEITALDVGQGTAIVLRTANRALLFGTGETYGTDGRIVENIVLPFLRHQGIDRIDTLVVPQPKGPSEVGVTALLAQIPVARTLAGASCATSWTWDGVRFDSSPDCVLRIAGSGDPIVFEGNRMATARWTVVSGRRPRDPGAAAAILSTDEGGAIRVLFDPARGLSEPESMRAARTELWRLPP